jgi:hypothetical protein
MIRLRQQIERGLRHPVVGPLLVLLLAVLVVFIALHETSEGIAGHVELICVAIAIVLLAAVPFAEALHVAARPLGTNPSRGPPPAERRFSPSGIRTSAFHPLRL